MVALDAGAVDGRLLLHTRRLQAAGAHGARERFCCATASCSRFVSRSFARMSMRAGLRESRVTVRSKMRACRAWMPSVELSARFPPSRLSGDGSTAPAMAPTAPAMAPPRPRWPTAARAAMALARPMSRVHRRRSRRCSSKRWWFHRAQPPCSDRGRWHPSGRAPPGRYRTVRQVTECTPPAYFPCVRGSILPETISSP